MRNRNYYQQQNQRQLVDNNASLVQNNYTLHITKVKEDENKASRTRNNSIVNLGGIKARISNDPHFVMCQSCYWCASYFHLIRLLMLTDNKCPSCHDGRVESMPLSRDETYRIDLNTTRGLVLNFSRD